MRIILLIVYIIMILSVYSLCRAAGAEDRIRERIKKKKGRFF